MTPYKTETKVLATVATMAIVLGCIVGSMIGTGCASVDSADPAQLERRFERVGRGIATAYYLSDEHLSPEKVLILKAAWRVFDHAIDSSPSRRELFLSLMSEGIGELDLNEAERKDVRLLAFGISADILDRISDKEIEQMGLALILEHIHSGIESTIDAHERWEVSDSEPEYRALE